MALLGLVERRRPNVKIMVNKILDQMRFLNESGSIVPVDVIGSDTDGNRSSMRDAIRFVRDGGALVVLPAGAVSHLDLKNRVVTDDPWTAHIGGLARLSKATVVPAYIKGRNSAFFQCIGLIHPILRTLMLPNELVLSLGMDLPIRFGEPVSADRVSRFDSSDDLAQYLRARTYLLADRTQSDEDPALTEQAATDQQSKWANIASKPSHNGDELQQELDALGSDARLIAQSDLEVWCARAGDIPPSDARGRPPS